MEICHNHDASIAYCNDEYGDCPLCRANDAIAEFKDVIAELKKDVEKLKAFAAVERLESEIYA